MSRTSSRLTTQRMTRLALLAAAAVGGELLIWRAIHRFVVR